MNLTEAFEVLLKGRKMDVGTISTRANGVQYQKQGDGKWVEYKKPQAQITEKEDGKSKSSVGKTNDVVFGDNVYKLPADRFPNPPTKKSGVRVIFDSKSGGDVYLHDVIRDIRDGKLDTKLSRDTREKETPTEKEPKKEKATEQETKKENTTPNEEDTAKNEYKNANIIIKGSVSNKQAIEKIKLSGVPEGFDGDVVVSTHGKFTFVSIENDDLSMSRSFYKGSDAVENIGLTVKNKSKYNGTEILKKQVDSLKGTKYKSIETVADKRDNVNGYYTWLRLGYKPDADTNRKYTEKANDALGTNISSITELMYSQEGRDWWKNNGGAFNGVFDLTENSYSMETLDEYVKNKNK
jgi:hypothetical protein